MNIMLLLMRKGGLCQNRRTYSKLASKVDNLYILSAGRTPFGLFNDVLNKFTAPQLGSFALTEALHRAVIPIEDVQNVFLGCALQEDYNEEIFRRTGLSTTVKVNLLPACGMENFIQAIKFLFTSSQSICLAGGMGSASNSFSLKCQKILHFIKSKQNDTRKVLNNHFTNLDDLNKYVEQDYKNFIEANKNGAFCDELFRIAIINREGHTLIAEDEMNRKDCTSSIALKVISFGFKRLDFHDKRRYCCGVWAPAPGDGATATVISWNNHLTPLVKIVSFAKGSVRANNLPLAQLRAIEKALKLAELQSEEIARWEIDSIINAVIFNCINHLNINISLVNKGGGTFILGYPVGIFGIRALCHLTHSLSAGELGCVATCDYSGTASAVIIKKLNGGTSEKPLLTLHSKKSFPLCYEMKEQLKFFKDQFLFQEIDIERKENKKYRKIYRYEVPVLFLDGKFLCKYKLDAKHFKRRLLEAAKFNV